MRYRLTCLTPLLVGDGRKLSPIDYMVWKDHVNVLDQWRIFRLLAKGPRLEGYLTQLKNAEKLDFAVVGRLRAELRRPPHSVRESGLLGVLESRGGREPAHPDVRRRRVAARICRRTAIKGALRTGMVFAQLARRHAAGCARPREGRAAAAASRGERGRSGARRRRAPTSMRFVSAGDSATVADSAISKSTCCARPRCSRAAAISRSAGRQSPRGAVDGARPDDSTPAFAEMAAPGHGLHAAIGTRRRFFLQPEVRRARALAGVLRPRQDLRSGQCLRGGSARAAAAVRVAGRDGAAGPESGRTGAAAGRRARENGSCLLSLGWGGGLPPRAPGWTRPIPTTGRSCSSSRSTIARWRRICRSRRRAASCF